MISVGVRERCIIVGVAEKEPLRWALKMGRIWIWRSGGRVGTVCSSVWKNEPSSPVAIT